MSRTGPIPVLVGVGQILQRAEDPREAAEPLALMVAALVQAGDDSGAPELLARADSIYVPRGAWRYGDPGREVARRLGAAPRETVGTPYGGNFAQACVIDAARAIQAGRAGVVLVAGAENGRSAGQAQRLGIELPQSEAPGAPDRKLAEDKAIFHDAELARGMNSASDVFAVIESALRFARGETLAAHAARIAELWAGFSAVALRQSHAWIRKPHSAEQIGRASPDNPMISYPYTRLMNANARVDMAAGLVLCSLEAARGAGVPDDKLVFLHAATEANDSNFLSTRVELHRSPAVRLAGARALELAGRAVGEIDHFDLYSCFPSSVQVAAAELGIPEGRPLTVTGGLTFGGGPLNSYGLHAVARMAEVVREQRGSIGLVHGNGGWLAKHSLGLYSAEPPGQAFRYDERAAAGRCLAAARGARRLRGPRDRRGLHRRPPEGRAAHRPCGMPHRRRSSDLGDAERSRRARRDDARGALRPARAPRRARRARAGLAARAQRTALGAPRGPSGVPSTLCGRKRADMRFGSAAVGWVGCAALALLLPGCSSVGTEVIGNGRGAYNEIIKRTDDEQLLAMIVRTRYGESAGLLMVTSVTANVHVAGSVGANLGIGPDSSFEGNLVPLSAGAVYEVNPTISYAPLQGERFARQLLAPLPLEELLLLARTLRGSELVLGLFVEQINGLRNPLHGGPQPEFERAAASIAALQRDGSAQWWVDPEPPAHAQLVLSGRTPEQREEVRELVEALGLPPLPAGHGEAAHRCGSPWAIRPSRASTSRRVRSST